MENLEIKYRETITVLLEAAVVEFELSEISDLERIYQTGPGLRFALQEQTTLNNSDKADVAPKRTTKRKRRTEIEDLTLWGPTITLKTPTTGPVTRSMKRMEQNPKKKPRRRF